MNRRGFFERMLAASAALVVASRATPTPAATARPKALAPAPKTAITADASKLTSAVEAARLDIERLLKDCRVMKWELREAAGELRRIRATYDYDPQGKRTEYDDHVEAMVGGGKGKVVSATVSAMCDRLDVQHLGEWRLYDMTDKRYEVEVEWYVR